MSRLEIRPEDRIRLKLTGTVPVFQVEIDIASKKPKQEADDTDYYPHDEADENILKHRPNTSDVKTSGQKEHEHPIATEDDVHQMTAHGDTGHRETSLRDQMTIVRLVYTRSLPPPAIKSVSPSTTVNLQVVQEINRDMQKTRAILLEQRAPPTHVNVESQFYQKLDKNMKHFEVIREILCRKYFDKTRKNIYQQAVFAEEYMRDLI